MANEKKARMLPNDLEAEQSLLGCLFLSQDACMEVFSMVKPSDFYSNAHQKIYEAMLDNYSKDVPIDYITVSKVLTNKGELEEVGGLGYITDLTNFVPSAANFKHYAEIVKNDGTLRQVIEASQQIINDAFDGKTAKDVLEKAEKNIFDIAQTRRTSELVHVKKGITEVIDLMEKLAIDPNANMGVKVGFPTLDRMTNGFKDGELIIIAARPGIGKTTLAVNFAINAALKHGKSIAMFDLEMSTLQVAQRFLCATSRVPLNDVKTGTKDSNVWNTIFETKKILENTNIYVDDTTNITPNEILSKCRKLKAQHGLDMIIIDYLQLMKSERASKDGSRQQEVADLTRSIKLAARELHVPIILLSQLNRDSDKQNRKPQLTDLRESGSIEQDADIVMFISDIKAEEVPDSNDDAKDYTLIIAKHRNGERGEIPIKFKGEYTQFYEPGKDILYTKNTSKVQKDSVMTAVVDKDIDAAFGE